MACRYKYLFSVLVLASQRRFFHRFTSALSKFPVVLLPFEVLLYFLLMGNMASHRECNLMRRVYTLSGFSPSGVDDVAVREWNDQG